MRKRFSQKIRKYSHKNSGNNMQVKAKLNYLRMSPRKVRLAADLIRGLEATAAENQLKFLPKRAALPMLKLLNSAIANAKHSFGIEKENLYISKITVNTGPILKRWRSRSRGMAVPIKKRTSHIEIVLEERPSFAKTAVSKKGKRKVKKTEKAEGTEKIEKVEKLRKRPSFRPEKEILKPKKESIVKRVFKRKAF